MTTPLLTVKRVAELLALSPRGVRDLIDRGELAATRVSPRKWAVSEATLDAYVAARTSKGNVVSLNTRGSR